MKVAKTFIERFIGLTAKKSLNPSEGMLFAECTNIHTLFMRFSIDVLFLDRDNRIIKSYQGLKPFRFTSFYKGTEKILELKDGSIKRNRLNAGDRLLLVKNSKR